MSLTSASKQRGFAGELGRGVSLVAMSGASVGGVLGIAALGLRALGL